MNILGKHIILRRVSGDSMFPTLRPGTIVLAARSRSGYKVGDVVIFEHDGLEKIKRVSEIKPGKLYVRGDNPLASMDSRQFGWLDTKVVKGSVRWPKMRN